MGIIAQCRSGVTGRRQALVVLVLFIVTGMAIVFYLNQGPTQARDRDYSFAGSFYAWCIWGGLGIISIYRWLKALMRNKLTAACASVTLAMIVPLQMLSQTADDHDRSGRTVARDMVQNQLKSLKPRALIFSAEDNYLFPMLYMQQVEHARPDVRMLTMPYMVTDWYASQLSLPLRDGSHLPLTGTPGHFTSWKLSYVVLGTDTTWTEALPALKSLYANCDAHRKGGYLTLPTPRVYIDMGGDTIRIDLRKRESGLSNFLRNDALIQLDLLATNAASANPRPIYVVSSLAGSLLGGQLRPYLSQVGTVSELNPKAPRFDAETIARYALYHWNYGGAGRTPAPYFDPVAAHNLSVQRRVIIRAAMQLAREKTKPCMH